MVCKDVFELNKNSLSLILRVSYLTLLHQELAPQCKINGETKSRLFTALATHYVTEPQTKIIFRKLKQSAHVIIC